MLNSMVEFMVLKFTGRHNMKLSKARVGTTYQPKLPVTEYRPKGSNQRLANGDEIEAWDKRDLMRKVGEFHKGIKQGVIARDESETMSVEDHRKVVEARHEALAEALHDKTGTKWMALGETVTEEIYEALGREGFTRKVLGFKPIKRGDVARIAIRKKDVIGYYIASTSPTVVASVVHQSYVHPKDAYLTFRIEIDELELELADTDLLEHKYNDGLEQILREEDKRTKALLDAAAPTYNDLVFFNAFTPSVFQSMRTQIARWTLPVAHALISIDLWNDILTDTEFASYYDPVSKHQIIQEGNLGSFFGVTLLTDGFREENLQVLNPGEVYFLASPKGLGVLMERMPLTVDSINQAVIGRPVKGWMGRAIVSHYIANARGCVRGQRIA
jgi:hypothetical protein